MNAWRKRKRAKQYRWMLGNAELKMFLLAFFVPLCWNLYDMRHLIPFQSFGRDLLIDHFLFDSKGFSLLRQIDLLYLIDPSLPICHRTELRLRLCMLYYYLLDWLIHHLYYQHLLGRSNVHLDDFLYSGTNHRPFVYFYFGLYWWFFHTFTIFQY